MSIKHEFGKNMISARFYNSTGNIENSARVWEFMKTTCVISKKSGKFSYTEILPGG